MRQHEMVRLAAAVFIALQLACSGPGDIAGTSTNSGNARIVAVAGRASYENGAPVKDALVILRPSGYLADTVSPAALTTDSLGFFSIDSVRHGAYAIEVNDRRGFAVLRLFDADTLIDSSLDVRLTLVPSCTLAGSVRYDGVSGTSALVRIVGLERRLHSDASDGTFAFADLPEGDLKVVITPLAAQYSSTSQDVALVRGSRRELATVTLNAFGSEDYSQWQHAESLFVNASLARAAPGENLYGFPLLVRLDSSTVNFTEVLADGSDLRFSRDGRHLEFEIEHWDKTSAGAAVWVLVDTLLCQDTAQVLVMHSGNVNAQNFSSPGAVFGHQQGFTGVWHLSESVPGADGTARIFDAVGKYDGVDNNTSAAAGIAGDARLFDRLLGSHVDLGTNLAVFTGAQGITLESWVSTTGAGYDQNVLSFTLPVAGGQENYRADLRISGDHNVAMAIVNPGDSPLYSSVAAVAPDTVAKGTWYHIAASADFVNDSLHLYVNGVPIVARRYDFPVSQVSTTSVASADIGARVQGSKNYFSGVIDEPRAHHMRRSAAWIRMTCESTKPGSGAVRFGRSSLF